MASLANGLQFVFKYGKNTTYTVSAKKEKVFTAFEEDEGPKILVSIGSGVSIVKINSFDSFQRVGGTMIGGGTLIGLSNMMTGVKDFDRIIELASKGDHTKVDMMVSDIYGEN